MGYHVCEQSVDILPQVGKAGTNRKQRILGPGDAIGTTHGVDSTMKYLEHLCPKGGVCSLLGVQSRPVHTGLHWGTFDSVTRAL